MRKRERERSEEERGLIRSMRWLASSMTSFGPVHLHTASYPQIGFSTRGTMVQKIKNKRLNEQRHFRDEILPIQIIGFGLVTNVRWLSGGILHMLRSDLIPQQFCRCIRDVGIYTWEEARLLIAMILATPYSIVQINSIGTSSISVVLTVTAHIRKILATMSCGTPF